MIAAKVKKEIEEFVLVKGTNCSAIIMHPKTCSELYKEDVENFSVVGNEQRYKDYLLYRSLDIERNEIKIL